MTTLADVKGPIVEALRTLDASRPVNWDLVISLAKENGLKVTRQWLSKDADIQAEYRQALEKHKKNKASGVTRSRKPPDLLAALDHVRKLKAELVVRDRTIALYDERFIRYLDFIRRKDISISDLEADSHKP